MTKKLIRILKSYINDGLDSIKNTELYSEQLIKELKIQTVKMYESLCRLNQLKDKLIEMKTESAQNKSKELDKKINKLSCIVHKLIEMKEEIEMKKEELVIRDEANKLIKTVKGYGYDDSILSELDNLERKVKIDEKIIDFCDENNINY